MNFVIDDLLANAKDRQRKTDMRFSKTDTTNTLLAIAELLLEDYEQNKNTPYSATLFMITRSLCEVVAAMNENRITGVYHD